MDVKRFRLFAGPNGSGKSTLFESLRENGEIHTEIYISADRIEAQIKSTGIFYFNAYRVSATQEGFEKFSNSITSTEYFPIDKINKSIEIKSGVLSIKKKQLSLNSYIASVIAAYLTDLLLKTDQSFCLETVMSHQSKIEILKKANKAGFKTYLYFVCTENRELNVERVKLREEAGGHGVPEDKIKSRYDRSLSHLQSAIENVSVYYLIDNSDEFKLLVHGENGKILYKLAILPIYIQKFYTPKIEE